jgi:hypothetical protein
VALVSAVAEARPPAVRWPEARLVRAPRGLKFHPSADADGSPVRERVCTSLAARCDQLQPTAIGAAGG